MVLKLADGRTWQPRWALDPTRTLAVLSLPSRPAPAALLLDVPSLEVVLETLAQARGRMLPAAMAWQTRPLMRRIERLILLGE